MVLVHAACVLFSLAPLLVLGVPPIFTQPEQVHLSYPGVPGSMVVTWTTFNKTESEVEYGLLGGRLFEMSARGDTTLFVDSGEEKRKMYVHRVMLTDLKPAAAYVYHCGSDEGWSDLFSFTALNDSTSFSPRFALYGDLGNENPQSLARLQKETQLGMYDVILHIGDFAYDMHEDNGRIGDEFMRQVQSVAAYVPYMTCPGNHEATYNFSNYRNRFSMPGQTESLWYSLQLHVPVRFNMVNADEIAKLCYERFRQLPRRGKPEPGREWTLLAAVVQITRCANSDTVEKEVVSLGTGTKCIGQTAMSPNGDVLNDSHAEVIARRGCVRYLIQELHRAVSGGDSSVFCQADQRGKWRLQPGVSFLFFTSHTPCGDASIIPMTDQSQPCPSVTSVKGREGTDGGGDLKRKAQETSEGKNAKLPRLEEQQTAETKLEDRRDTKQSFLSNSSKSEAPSQSHSADTLVETFSQDSAQPEIKSRGPSDRAGVHPQVLDIHRTGAKCVPSGPTDPLRPGVGYHSTGVLRVKPGRGEPTLSLSCSDKLARWGVLGFQGALLFHYLQEALYFSTVVVGKCPFSQEVMQRALVTRCSNVSNLPAGFSVRPPVLLQSSLEFPFSKAQTELRHQAGKGRISPCGAAISWCNVTEQPLDVTANGYKHGVTKKDLGTAKARSLLCKLELFHSFLSLVSATDFSALPDSLRRTELQTYWDYKQDSQLYQQAWQQLHSQAFPLWPRSDRDLLLFH